MKPQKFKGRKLSHTSLVNNILKIYDDAPTKKDWYVEANNFANYVWMKYYHKNDEGYPVTMAKICGVIAALSPLKSWEENKRIAVKFITTGKCEHTGTMKDKAKRILESNGDQDVIAGILNGNKITAFFLNMVNPKTSNVVTIDRHAQDIALGEYLNDASRSMTSKQYEFFQHCYVIAANKRDVRPSMMQSVTWEHWRQLKKQEEFKDVPF